MRADSMAHSSTESTMHWRLSVSLCTCSGFWWGCSSVPFAATLFRSWPVCTPVGQDGWLWAAVYRMCINIAFFRLRSRDPALVTVREMPVLGICS
ncbi:hypothetical protein H4582DRAFT_1967866 [Lactarius indigo]|nr:hypothetical protein H4582DRAFT_1967866 [Lactarius indigo]